ncbi:phage distal tail protein [Streptomyces sp. 8L]|uniref:phage distal tail protein n=1 Tax=Streptomyces sp. 8L TaxID=2877242 RepID=UPI001CD32A1C|nr:phage tail domain-containing protein [Streptomyces sp. 8L]MCA1218705.1 phage tail family protein [Streptomyces sp. 8L]
MAGLAPGTSLGGLVHQLGDIRFNEVAPDGVYWYLATNDGWDSPDVRTTLTAREADHGSWMGPVYLAERVITLAGKFRAPDPATVDTAIAQLKAAAGLHDTTLTVFESTPRQATVRRSGKPLMQRLTSRVVDWSVQVTAPDPRLYATTETTAALRLPSVSGGLTLPIVFPFEIDATVVPGDAAVINEGSIDARPTIRIDGPVSQPLVVVTGPDGSTASLLYGGDIAAGDWLELDTDAHTAYYNNTASRRALVSGDWPVLPPGQSTVSFRAGAYSDTAVCTLTYRSAWE